MSFTDTYNSSHYTYVSCIIYWSIFLVTEYIFHKIVVISFFVLSGMTVRVFKGFPSLQEVECSTGHLKASVKVFSLKMLTGPQNTVLAHANPVTNECVTFKEFSSCKLDLSDTRKSVLRVLVSDLEEGESRRYRCTATSFGSLGETNTSSWSITVWRKSKCWCCRDLTLLLC